MDIKWISNSTDTDFNTMLIIMVSVLGFIIYWFYSISSGVKRFFTNKYPADKANLKHLLSVKLAGLVFMGLIPLMIFSLFLRHFNWQLSGLVPDLDKMGTSFKYFLGLLLVLLPLIYLNAGKADNIVHYPQLRNREWDLNTAVLYAAGWAVYLLGYEVLFRGVLLFGLNEHIGTWPAIAVNMALYSATHIPKGSKETYGAIPLGFIMCLLTLASGSVWYSFAAHLSMALTNSFTALKKNPEFKFTF